MVNKNFSCPVCKKEVFSDLGRGCKMCGMPVSSGEYCCKICMRKHNTIIKSRSLKNE